MRRLGRLLLNASTLLSLLLCAAATTLWARSYWIADSWHAITPSLYCYADTWPGWLAVGGWNRTNGEPAWEVRWLHLTRPPDFGAANWRWNVMDHQRRFGSLTLGWDDPAPPQRSGWLAGAPLWLIASLAAGGPTLRIIRALRRRRARAGHCQTCGYDLRATPARCPECGQTVSALTPSPTTPPAQSGAHP